MVVFYSDEQVNPKIEMAADAGYTLRRTSARIKTREAKNEKRSAPAPAPAPATPTPAKMDRKVKKRKLESPPQLDDDVADADVSDAVVTTSTDVSETDVAASAAGKSVHAQVTETLRAFNKHYLHFIQEEENRVARLEADKKRNTKKGSKSKKEDTAEEYAKKPAKRPDLKAISEMMKTGAILNHEKRFGSVPGVDVGHQFFSRAEMVVVGFHQHWLNGIDYIGKTACSGRKARKGLNLSKYKLPLTISIVLSGQYEDDLDNCEDIIYTGQGGNNLLGDKRQISDQKLERGNLGLKAYYHVFPPQNCMEQSLPVRVVRGHKCTNSYVGKVYTYDGLYKVVNYWAEKGVSGFTVYKFRLKRLEGQPPLTTKEVYFTRGRIPQSLSEIRGLVCEDITGGLEDIPIPVTNLVDDPPISPLGSGFVYIKDMKYSKNISVPTIAPTGCNCRGSCVDSRLCACAKLNGGDFPYVQRDGGRLVEPKAVVFECGPSCKCGPKCVNRTGQKGCRFRLEIFRTPKKGWGVRSWDYIPSGAPICEYIGLLRRTAELNHAADNSYVFDIDCLQTMKGMDGRESRLRDVSLPSHLQKIGEEASESVPFCIDAAQTGNVARFINHSCQPNLFVQCMLSCHHDIKQAKIMFVAADNIPPLKELTYDYGYALDSVIGPDGKIQQMACYCGADECRKRLF
ncbi:histone-lysine n-methyltransferase h3 lysine-9 specific suvh4 [Phtheirospermum japonicum]|uniref:Histone-lysine n-methyltransferase h3 lysine-9 specific suvh4 n=1 Tax=Phtheirospermum japonicum TaxID=374723 RepID=A0A830CXD4_9LAMI|nr:histone-lysine n-methyltransferase h3 lysine-9 specific suvh4 [Phtheirospermum japonicum]